MNRIALVSMVAALAAAGWTPASAENFLKEPPPGYRGMALPVQDYELQFLKAGDRVDVLTTFEAKLAANQTEWVTATLLQNVLILDAKPASGESRTGALQLALNPNEAQYLSLALKSKKIISVLLRANGDHEMHPMEMASFGKLFR